MICFNWNSISIRQAPPAKAVAKKAAPVKAVKNGKAAVKQENDDDVKDGKRCFHGSLGAVFLI